MYFARQIAEYDDNGVYNAKKLALARQILADADADADAALAVERVAG